MILAQGLLEYGILHAYGSGIQGLADWTKDFILHMPDSGWIAIVGVALVGTWFWVRKS